MLCFHAILQKESLQSPGLFFSIPGFTFPFLQGIFSCVTSRINFPVLPLQFRLCPFSQFAMDDSCRGHTFKVRVPFNISPSCNLPSGFCFVLLWAIRSVTQNNSTPCFVFRVSCSKTTELKESNLLSFCSFSFFLCVICLFNLFTSAWKDSTTRSLFSTSMQTA